MSATHPDTRERRGGHRLAMLGGGLSLVARRLRLDPAAALTMLVLVAATCFLFAALPRLFNGFADDGLRYTIAQAPFAERNPRLIEPGRVPAGPAADPLANVERRAAEAQHEVLPAPLDELVSGHASLVRSRSYVQSPNAGLVRYVTFDVQPEGVEQQIRLVSGRLPRPTTGTATTVVDPVASPPRAGTVPVLEVAFSTTTARELELKTGDRLILAPNLREPEVQHVPVSRQRPVGIDVVGIFAVDEPDASFWFGDPTLDRPNLEYSPDLSTKYVFAHALLARDQYPAVLAATRPFSFDYEYRYLLDESRLDGGALPGVRAATNQVEARWANAGPQERRVELGLGPIVDRFRSASSQAKTLLAVAALGLLACALANLGLLGALTQDRRRTETTVSRVRGGSPRQLLGLQAAEAAAIAVPAGIAGWALAVLAIDARGSTLSAWLVAAVVVGTIVLLVASLSRVARRPLGSLAPQDVVPEGAGRGRLALEALVAVAALLGVYLVRRRGLDASGFGASGEFDPYLAVVPVLLGLACGLAVMRLHAYPLRAAARLARRTKGLALHLGLVRASRQPDTTAIPVIVLVVALALATFAATMASTIRGGQDAEGWRTVGADVRIDAPEDGSLPAGLVDRLASQGTVARAFVQESDLSNGSQGTLLALDAPAYEAVVAGTPAAVSLHGALDKPSPIPSLVSAVVSTDWPALGNFQLSLPNQTVSFLSVGDRTSLPGVPQGTLFAVVSLKALRAAGGQSPVNRLYVSGVREGAVRDAVRELAPDATIRARADVARGLRASPLVDGALRGFDWAVVVAAIFAALAVVLLVLLAARSRSRDLALVRTMGGRAGDVLVLSLVELAPLVVLGVVLGVGLGVAIPYLIEPGLDLSFFTGSSTAAAIAVPWATVGWIAVALVALLVACVLLVGRRARRADLGRVLRVGER